MTLKHFFALIAIALTLMAFLPYIRSILRGAVKPHAFSWIIWGAITLFVFFAQVYDDGGAGAWPTGVTGMITIFVAFLAYKKSAHIQADKLDWLFLLLAFFSLPLWYVTSDPLWSVVILTTIDVFGFFPTIRKAYEKPYEESLLFFSIFITRNTVSIFALENYTLTTVLFPAATGIAAMLLIAIVVYRRSIEHRSDYRERAEG